MMSRRRISVKELGPPDHQGWLYRKKEGKGFLGIKWKKYWFVLKKTALYWYANQLAEKAEGYIDLANFMIDRAIECKKKHALKACHPNVMMFYFAAESHEEMNMWLNKLGLASIQYESTERNTAVECYSEASDHEEAESTEIPPPPYSEQTLRDSVDASGPPGSTHQGTLPPPYSSTVAGKANGSLSSPVSTMTSESSTSSSLAKHRQSWLDLVSQASPPAAETAVVCSVQVHSHRPPPPPQQQQKTEEEEEDPQLPESSSHPDPSETGSSEEGPAAEGEAHMGVSGAESEGDGANGSDEMEKLYIHLKAANLSPIGDRKPSTKREFRASFVRRCKNHTVNEKLHLIRTLNSTLKSKEADLHALDKVLADLGLTSTKFREWKEVNATLMQEICEKQDQQGAAEATKAAASVVAAPVVETSL